MTESARPLQIEFRGTEVPVQRAASCPRHGRRKIEANALARDPTGAAAMIKAAINRYVPADWPERYAARLTPYRAAARRTLAARR